MKNIQLGDFTRRIQSESGRVLSHKDAYQTELTANEGLVLSLMQERGSVSRKDVETKLNCGATTAWKILNSLVNWHLIEKTGSSKNLKYIIKQQETKLLNMRGD